MTGHIPVGLPKGNVFAVMGKELHLSRAVLEDWGKKLVTYY